MKKLLPALFTAWMVLALAAPCAAHGDDAVVVWMYSSFPPFHITEGPHKGRGMADRITDLLIARLPEYRHERLEANTSRKMALFAQGEHVASANFLRTTEREGFMVFSVPSILANAPGIVLLKQDRDLFPADDPVPLQAILENPSLSLGIVNSRSYGRGPDRVLERHQGARNLYCYEGSDTCPGLFRMLLSGRLKGFLAGPSEARFLAVSQGVEDRVATLSLSESEPFVMGHVAAPDTPWGRAFIQKVNRILEKERPTPEYRAIMEEWLPPESREWFDRAYREIFLAPAPPAVVPGGNGEPSEPGGEKAPGP